MILLDKFNADIEFRLRKEPTLEVLYGFLSLKIITNPYSEISKTRDEIESQFKELKFKLGNESGFYLWSIYYELLLSYYQYEEDEVQQLEVFKEAKNLLSGKNGTKYWASFVLKNYPDHILKNPNFDFKSVMDEVELFLQKRGWLDDVSELSVKMYLLKIQYYIANELWAEAENTIREAKATMPIELTNQSFVKFTIALLQKEKILQSYTGKIEHAEITCSQAIDLCRLNNLKHRLVDMLIGRTIIYRKLGKLDAALADITMAMLYIKEIGNMQPSNVGVSIFQFGQILKEAGNFKEAMKQYNDCQQYWPNNSKGEYRKMVTEMNMVYCISNGQLNPNDYFPISINDKRNQIIDFFKMPENEIQLSPVNRKNLMGLSELEFT
jgi:hypothetical protein